VHSTQRSPSVRHLVSNCLTQSVFLAQSFVRIRSGHDSRGATFASLSRFTVRFFSWEVWSVV
jgi:hypothetical protein